MRIWDIAAGYLNRQSLLAEHRELHGVHIVLVHGKKGYARHPETLRWVGYLPALAVRHQMLVAEMALRGYRHQTPIANTAHSREWPGTYVTQPGEQFDLLRIKYVGKACGRIALPRDTRELWAQHKYSVMARDPALYRKLGRSVSSRNASLPILAAELVHVLREPPSPGRLVNALEHMWGHVKKAATPEDRWAAQVSCDGLLRATQEVALRIREPYLIGSTALSELAIFAKHG